MAAVETLQETLSSFTTATLAANEALPTFSPDTEAGTTQHGISLLSAKNEIFLAYLQVLALRNLHVLRSFRNANAVAADRDGDGDGGKDELEENLTKKLCELRVYLERGVKPLEGKIEYQIGKVIRAAEEEERAAASAAATAKGKVNGVNGKLNGKHNDDHDEEDEDSSDEDEDEDDDEDEANSAAIPSTAHRANASNFAQPASQIHKASSSTSSKLATDGDASKPAIYRPPRISATTMPTTRPDDPTSTNSTSNSSRSRRQNNRSAVLDDYISTELSTAPQAQPSIGSNIGAASGGRGKSSGGQMEKSSRQLAREAERRVYEENNFVRLPKESKKDLAAERRRSQREQGGGGFGGEEWRGLGDSVDRIHAVTKAGGGSRGERGILERSRKRKVGGGGGGGEDGVGGGTGDAFERRKKRVLGRKSMRG